MQSNSPLFNSPVGSFWLPAVTPEGSPMHFDEAISPSDFLGFHDVESASPSNSTSRKWRNFESPAESAVDDLPELELESLKRFSTPSMDSGSPSGELGPLKR
jgi:hypothetical protein